MKIIDCIIEYSGKATRSGDLFSNKDLMAKGKQFFQSIFKDVQNVLLQHKPMLFNVVDLALKGKLPTTDYPVIASDLPYSQST